MKKLLPLTVLLTFLCANVALLAANPSTANTAGGWPTCLAEFCFDSDLLPVSFLKDNYGLGQLVKEDEGALHCYYDSKQKKYVKIWDHNNLPPFIVGMLVSDMPNCTKTTRPTAPFKRLQTAEGLAINDAYAKVTQLYGKPLFVYKENDVKQLQDEYFSKIYEKVKFDSALCFGPNSENDLLRSWVFMKKGKVKAILIGRFE